MDPDRALARLAERQYGLVARGQALDRGLLPGAINRRVGSGRWERSHPGVYRIAGSAPCPEQTMLAACLAVGPGAVLSHWSAAAVHGLAKAPNLVEVTVVGPGGRDVRGIKVHRAVRLDRVDHVWVRRLPVSAVARTLIDLAGDLEAEPLEVLVDEAVSRRLVSLSYLRARLKALGTRGRRGTGTMAAILEARGNPRRPSRTDFERRLAKALDEAGLPHPVREHPVRLPDGRMRYPDLSYPELRLAIEADSYRHHSSLVDWSKDHTRNRELLAVGWRVFCVTYEELLTNRAGVTDDLRASMESCRKTPDFRA